MANAKVEERLAVLEAEVARLKQRLDSLSAEPEDPWKKLYGSYANDPAFEEAMRLGRKYRESLRPKLKKRRKDKHVGAGH
jgi:predicted nuclease with TOPRIM domain